MKKSISSINDLYKSIARKLSGLPSNKDNERVSAWLKSSPEAAKEYEELKRVWNKRFFEEDDIELVSQKEVNHLIWKEVFDNKLKDSFKVFYQSIFIKVAAAVIFIVMTALAMVCLKNEIHKQDQSAVVIQKQTLPGQKSTIPLPDGSIVYLNSGSRISYNSEYNDSLRIIELEGQAFFDVFRDTKKPFIVNCRELVVEALGTSFDVNGLDLESIQVSLVSGKVKLMAPGKQGDTILILNPGEQSIVDKSYNLINKGHFDPYEVLAWKKGRLIFKDASLKEIIPKLEMWYGVRIDDETVQLSNKHFNSTFEKENLDNILCNMGLSMGFTHKIHGNIVTLKNK